MQTKKIIVFYKKLSFVQGFFFAICLTSAISAAAVGISGFFSFSPGTPISSSQINSNFDKLASLIDNSRSQNYVGTWSASTNTPDLDATVSTPGDYYIVSTAGTHLFSNGDSIVFAVGDWAIYNGISWEKIHITGGSSQWTTSTSDIYYGTGNVGIGTTTPGSLLDIKGTMRLSGTTTGFVGLAAPATSSGVTYTLPVTDGSSGDVLTTNGSAALSWSTPSVGGSSPTGPASGDLSGSFPSPTITALSATKISSSLVDDIEFNYLDGVTGSIQAQLNSKEPIITGGTLTQYYRGDKTWQSIDTGSIAEGVNLYFTIPRVMTASLTGFTSNNTAISASDTILSALGKSQGQIDNKISRTGDTINSGTFNFTTTAVLRTLDPIGPTDVATKQYVDSLSSPWLPSSANIYFTGGNVGIGTGVPTEMLDVETSALNAAASIKILNSSSLSGAQAQFIASNGSYDAQFGISSASFTGPQHLAGSSAYLTSATTNGFNISTTFNTAPIKFWTSNGTITERMRIDSSGNVGIGTTTPGYTLHINGTTAGTSAFVTISDLRFKKNIHRIPNALEKITALNGVYYDWRRNEFPEYKFNPKAEMGVIAQQVEKVFPEAVSIAPNGYRSVAYSMLIAPMIEALKEIHQWMFVNDKKMEELINENKLMKDYLCQKDGDAPFCFDK